METVESGPVVLHPVSQPSTGGTSEPSPTETGGDDKIDSTYISEADLKGMSMHSLMQLCGDNDIQVPESIDNKADLLAFLLETFGV